MASSRSRRGTHEESEPTIAQLISVMIRQSEDQQAREERAREEWQADREERRAREERAEKAKEERRAEKLARREEKARRALVPRQGNIESFFKLRPSSFLGSEDALAAEGWLKEIDKFLNAVRILEEDKVSLPKCFLSDILALIEPLLTSLYLVQVPYATLLLKDNALIWWEAELQKYQSLEIEPSWAQFSKGFLKKFFPATQETLMEIKFANLVQGAMTVDEYTAEFTRLSRFCPEIAASSTAMMKKFSRGLRQEIQDDFAVVDLTSFDEVLETARKLELVHQRKKARVQQALERRSVLQQTVRPQEQQIVLHQQQFFPRPLQQRIGEQRSQVRGQLPGKQNVCTYCHRSGHVHKDCRWANNLCLRCGAPDHAVAFCSRLPAPVPPRRSLPSQSDVHRQQGGRFQKRAQALQMIASAQEFLQEAEEPGLVQEDLVGDDQDNQFFQDDPVGW